MKKALKIGGIFLGVIAVLLIVGALYVVSVSQLEPPEVEPHPIADATIQRFSETDRRLGANRLVRNPWGNWELYLTGGAYERGLANGKLCSDLLYEQERHFTDQIQVLVPDPAYLDFLKYFVGFFNRHLNDHVPLEYQREIYGVSRFAPDTFDFISAKYDRMMNYHAAHDIGHALQNLALVGCTSFSVNHAQTADGGLLVGRNFDFYAGDGFAENKIIAFVKPDSGYAFASVTWAGMIGVVSGMNEAGLTITLNAAPSDVPSAAATPISILAREILQYAGNIAEAQQIAESRQTFVSELLMVASAADDRTVLIEKTPDQTGLFDPEGAPLICSNHFQSPELSGLPRNRESLSGSDSPYRYQLMQALLDTAQGMTPARAVRVLRHREGLPGDTLGLGNPMAINQLIAHHGVVFQPDERRMWVSANPFQLGAFAAYDLDDVFSGQPQQNAVTLAVDSLAIPASPFLDTPQYAEILRYKAGLKRLQAAERNKDLTMTAQEVDDLLALNPHYYLGYQRAGEYFMSINKPELARAYLYQAARCKIPYAADRQAIQSLLDKIERNAS